MLLRRPVCAADVDGLARLFAVPDVYRYLWDGEPAPREAVAAIIAASEADFARHGYGLWVAEDPTDPAAGIVGMAGLRDLPGEDGRVEVLYALHPAYWGAGHATALARQALAAGFATGLDEILAVTDLPNVASQRVVQRLGLRRVADVSYGDDALLPCWAIDRASFAAGIA